MECPTAKVRTDDETLQRALPLRKTPSMNTFRLAQRSLRVCRHPPSSSKAFSHVAQPPSRILRFLESKIWRATHRETRVPSHSRPPPRPNQKWWLDSLRPELIFYGIMVVNGAVFLAWQYAGSELVCLLLSNRHKPTHSRVSKSDMVVQRPWRS
jgi:hypothetical protein